MNKATLGKILGAFGLLLLLSSPFTYFLTTGSPLLTAGKALMGAGLIAAFFATNYGQIGQFASRRSTYFILSSVALVLVVIAALVAVNYIAAQKNQTWDLTHQKIFTLAPQTQSTLANLPQPVRALAFIQPDHPYYEPLENLLRRYRDQAPEKFEYRFKDPRKAPDLAAKYQLKEGQTTVVLTRGSGEGESHTALNVVSEQELTNALIKLAGVGDQKVYFVVGHGEWPLEPPTAGAMEGASLSELRGQLMQEGYAPQPLALPGQTEVPRDAALVVLAGPRSPLTEQETNLLRAYLAEGGRLLFFAETNTDSGPHLFKLLADYGVEVDHGLIADDRFAVDSPYMPLSMFYGEHETTALLSQMQINVQFPTVRGLTALRTGTLEGVTTLPLVLTSPYAWVESTPDENPERSPGEKSGQIPLVLAITRPTASAPQQRYDEARLVVFGDSELLADANWGHEGNRNLVMNTLGWASNQVAKITLRPPDRGVSTLEIDPGLMNRIRFVATDLLPLSLLGIGLAIWLKRRTQ